ncbi:MAG: preprotein translocase subunit SecD [Acutalibacteraceae bacterium]
MKRVSKPVFLIIAILIFSLAYLSVFGVLTYNGDIASTKIKGIKDIRWGIDIKGGVEATFKPANDVEATDEQMDSAKAIIETRLMSSGVTDYELYADYGSDRIIVRYPWKEDETSFDPEAAVDELAATALLTFREGTDYTEDVIDEETGEVTEKGNVILDGSKIISASAGVTTTENGTQNVVTLKFNEEGTELFSEATGRLQGQTISIWMDQTCISAPTVNEQITNGEAIITGGSTANGFEVSEAVDLATKINAGALPFALETVSFGSVSPTLGASSLTAMGYAAVIALIIICILMLVFFRLPGLIAVISLIGQLALTIAAVSGFFPSFSSFTMTLPGIAGMILSIGMGVDANIITAERIKEELRAGKTLDGAVHNGTKNSISAIVDGNITVVIVAVILILVFGPFNLLSAIFGSSTTGTIYSFGYTLLVGVISNFIMGVAASRLMLKSLSGYKFLRKKWLYGGKSK